MTKNVNNHKIFSSLEQFAGVLPVSMYWLTPKNTILYANDAALKMFGWPDVTTLSGKGYNDFYPKDISYITTQDNNKVLSLGESIEVEEKIIDATTGAVKYISSVKSPLKDEDGHIIGIAVTSFDITQRSEREIALEQKNSQIEADEQAKFKKVVNQVSHDIRSPIASMLIYTKSANHLAEDDRILIRDAITRINDIVNNLSAKYETKDNSLHNKEAPDHIIKAPLIVSTAINQILSEKRSQYRDSNIELDCEFSQESAFAFINIEDDYFKRMLSNLINNSVDAIKGKNGKIKVYLDCTDKNITITIEDNGNGMSQDTIDKIMSKVTFTEGKKDGTGIGLTQVRETLESNNGKLDVKSVIGSGTKMIVSFPRVEAPGWCAEEISLMSNDLVVILDDDPSIHRAWDTRFTKDAPNIKLKHFTIGVEAIEFINSFTTEEKDNIFLLSDFELLAQEVNGLEVIEQTKMSQSVLVTSHHNNGDVRKKAEQTQTKILPKSLAVDIPIRITDEIVINKDTAVVDLVIVDDDVKLAENLKKAFFSGRNVDIWGNPLDFLKGFKKYPQNTKICLDNNFKGFDVTGFNLGEELYKEGYTNLYLISGDKLLKNQIPHYINFIFKTDIDAIAQLAD